MLSMDSVIDFNLHVIVGKRPGIWPHYFPTYPRGIAQWHKASCIAHWRRKLDESSKGKFMKNLSTSKVANFAQPCNSVVILRFQYTYELQTSECAIPVLCSIFSMMMSQGHDGWSSALFHQTSATSMLRMSIFLGTLSFRWIFQLGERNEFTSMLP